MNESLEIAVKYCFAMLGLLMLIYLIAVLTPHIAGFIDRICRKSKEKSKIISFDDENDDIYKVRGIYDAQYKSSSEKNNNGDENNGEKQ